MEENGYRPQVIEFNVAHDGTNIPESLGEFKTAEEAIKFIGSNLIVVNQGMTVARHMDQKEKTELRQECTNIMENVIPIYEKNLSDAETKLTEAKNILKKAQEAYDFNILEAKSLAYQVKRGLKEITLDEIYTYRIAYKGRYYFFTYIDGQLKLCLIRDIPEFEKTEIWNQMAGNEEFIDKKFKKGKNQMAGNEEFIDKKFKKGKK